MRQLFLSLLIGFAYMLLLTNELQAQTTPAIPTTPPPKPRASSKPPPTADLAVTSHGSMPKKIIAGSTKTVTFYFTIEDFGSHDAPDVEVTSYFSENLRIMDIILSSQGECNITTPAYTNTVICHFDMMRVKETEGIFIVIEVPSDIDPEFEILNNIKVRSLSREVSDAYTDNDRSHLYVETCNLTSCSVEGKNCGSIPDGCGGILNCGTCPENLECGNDNVCHNPNIRTINPLKIFKSIRQ